MRARGALATDIVILVVAADDGVMNQTVESIRHAKRAGGSWRSTNATKLTPNPSGSNGSCWLTTWFARTSEGTSRPSTSPPSSPVTTALVQRGALRRGCVLVAGKTWAKVRFLSDERGRAVEEAGPGVAVEVVGWKDAPSAGDVILEVESEQRAREVSAWRSHEEDSERLRAEESAVRAQRERHRAAYRKEREALAHLSWRQRKSLLYRNNKTAFASRLAEKTPSGASAGLPLVIKGTRRRPSCGGASPTRSVSRIVDPHPLIRPGQKATKSKHSMMTSLKPTEKNSTVFVTRQRKAAAPGSPGGSLPPTEGSRGHDGAVLSPRRDTAGCKTIIGSLCGMSRFLGQLINTALMSVLWLVCVLATSGCGWLVGGHLDHLGHVRRRRSMSAGGHPLRDRRRLRKRPQHGGNIWRQRVRLQRGGRQVHPAGGLSARRPRQAARRHLQNGGAAQGRDQRQAAAADRFRRAGRSHGSGRVRRVGGQKEDGGGRLPRD
ncbi:translation initiation factor IF-2, mitochondrial [Syngnathoides biaculeatus]|uniref:translation initiation factor IF-2, mitochondrial n=1 Tax=Syngnathoides biaculeatus TaxID=300417 RepID=UPI002ADD5480|nr:translation initiation factor IF-2, mitochondrial [Syngnathoides biaculeatus]